MTIVHFIIVSDLIPTTNYAPTVNIYADTGLKSEEFGLLKNFLFLVMVAVLEEFGLIRYILEWGLSKDYFCSLVQISGIVSEKKILFNDFNAFLQVLWFPSVIKLIKMI